MTVLVTILRSFVTISSPRYLLGVLMPPTLATGVQKWCQNPLKLAPNRAFQGQIAHYGAKSLPNWHHFCTGPKSWRPIFETRRKQFKVFETAPLCLRSKSDHLLLDFFDFLVVLVALVVSEALVVSVVSSVSALSVLEPYSIFVTLPPNAVTFSL